MTAMLSGAVRLHKRRRRPRREHQLDPSSRCLLRILKHWQNIFLCPFKRKSLKLSVFRIRHCLIHLCRKITAVHMYPDKAVTHLIFLEIRLNHFLFVFLIHQRIHISRCIRDRSAKTFELFKASVRVEIYHLVFHAFHILSKCKNLFCADIFRPVRCLCQS